MDSGGRSPSATSLEILATVTQGSKILLWDAKQGVLVKEFMHVHQQQRGAITALRTSKDNKIISIGDSKHVNLYY